VLVRKEQQLLKAKALDRQNRPVIDLACYLIAVLIRIDTKKISLAFARSRPLLLFACSANVESRCDENGPGGCVVRQSGINSDMLLRRALPAACFDRNAVIPVTDLAHWCP